MIAKIRSIYRRMIAWVARRIAELRAEIKKGLAGLQSKSDSDVLKENRALAREVWDVYFSDTGIPMPEELW